MRQYYRNQAKSSDHLLLIIMVICFFSFTSPQMSHSDPPQYNEKLREVSNWKTEAINNLLIRDGYNGTREIIEADLHRNPKKLRCIKLNNQWCLKDLGWQGRVGKDKDGHTAFSFTKYAARALTRDLRTKYTRHNLKSAWAIISRYAPPDDCVGDIRRSDGSCRYGKNPTKKYAEFTIRGVANSIHDDLNLFDEDGISSNKLPQVIQNISNFEIAPFLVKIETIKEGIALEPKTNN